MMLSKAAMIGRAIPTEVRHIRPGQIVAVPEHANQADRAARCFLVVRHVYDHPVSACYSLVTRTREWYKSLSYNDTFLVLCPADHDALLEDPAEMNIHVVPDEEPTP